MIYLLDIVLLFNIFLAYRKFHVVVAPPILLGAGMLVASLVATTYYDEWEMGDMLLESVLILGGCSCLFTMTCILINGNRKIKWKNEKDDYLKVLRLGIINKVTWCLVIIGLFCCIMKMRTYIAYYGTFFDYSELIGEARNDAWEGNKGLVMPGYIVLVSYIENFFSYFSAWVLSVCIITKTNKKLQIVLFLQFLVVMIDGGLSGTKGLIFEPLSRFGVTFVLLYYCMKKTLTLPKKAFVWGVFIFLTVMLSFNLISNAMGRDHGVLEGNELFAIYIGAEIKNFDIYMHGNDGNPKNKFWGESTFFILYKEFHPNYRKEPGNFQGVGSHRLGNVYTQFYSFHKDFGVIGTMIMTMIIAFVSMFFYNKSIYKLNKSPIPNIYTLLYVTMSFHIFMSYFSCKFCENIMQTHFCKVSICLAVCVYFFNLCLASKSQRKSTLYKQVCV